MREELKPCPCCNGPAEMDTMQSYRNISSGRMETGVAIYCTECGVQAMLCRGDLPDLQPEEVISIWNTRAKPQGDVGADSGLPAADDNHKALVEAARAVLNGDGRDFGLPRELSGNLRSALAAFQSRQEEK